MGLIPVSCLGSGFLLWWFACGWSAFGCLWVCGLAGVDFGCWWVCGFAGFGLYGWCDIVCSGEVLLGVWFGLMSFDVGG